MIGKRRSSKHDIQFSSNGGMGGDGGAIDELKNTERGKTHGLGNTQQIVIQVWVYSFIQKEKKHF